VEIFRDLSLPEWNFRNIVSAKLISLLKQRKTYWRQRGKIRWVRKGDAGTKKIMPMLQSGIGQTPLPHCKIIRGIQYSSMNKNLSFCGTPSKRGCAYLILNR
jgi:hypothetical protein